MMTVSIQTFDQLDTTNLYHILQLRSAVFVVEQQCAYQDLDGADKRALHVLGFHGDTLVAYTRIFKPGDYFKEASIGRVVVQQEARGRGYGYDIMVASLEAIAERFGVTSISISAQTYLRGFYNSLGFVEKGEAYLEDGIPHIAMTKS